MQLYVDVGVQKYFIYHFKITSVVKTVIESLFNCLGNLSKIIDKNKK